MASRKIINRMTQAELGAALQALAPGGKVEGIQHDPVGDEELFEEKGIDVSNLEYEALKKAGMIPSRKVFVQRWTAGAGDNKTEIVAGEDPESPGTYLIFEYKVGAKDEPKPLTASSARKEGGAKEIEWVGAKGYWVYKDENGKIIYREEMKADEIKKEQEKAEIARNSAAGKGPYTDAEVADREEKAGEKKRKDDLDAKKLEVDAGKLNIDLSREQREVNEANEPKTFNINGRLIRVYPASTGKPAEDITPQRKFVSGGPSLEGITPQNFLQKLDEKRAFYDQKVRDGLISPEDATQEMTAFREGVKAALETQGAIVRVQAEERKNLFDLGGRQATASQNALTHAMKEGTDLLKSGLISPEAAPNGVYGPLAAFGLMMGNALGGLTAPPTPPALNQVLQMALGGGGGSLPTVAFAPPAPAAAPPSAPAANPYLTNAARIAGQLVPGATRPSAAPATSPAASPRAGYPSESILGIGSVTDAQLGQPTVPTPAPPASSSASSDLLSSGEAVIRQSMAGQTPQEIDAAVERYRHAVVTGGLLP